jgi:lysophospholipase L1-like esterase
MGCPICSELPAGVEMNVIETVLNRLTSGVKTRFVAFGSSNTERHIHGLHWFDWLDLGLKQTYGRVHHCINAGLGGDTSEGLLERFEEDVALYQPHVVMITIGGNDANPASGIDSVSYHRNLINLVDMVQDIAAVPILQTYYAADIPCMEEPHGSMFLQFMDIVRVTADETRSYLIDHHKRWEPLRLSYPDIYKGLMLDALHVNPLGNIVMGLDLIRIFRAHLESAQLESCSDGLYIQQLMDNLS